MKVYIPQKNFWSLVPIHFERLGRNGFLLLVASCIYSLPVTTFAEKRLQRNSENHGSSVPTAQMSNSLSFGASDEDAGSPRNLEDSNKNGNSRSTTASGSSATLVKANNLRELLLKLGPLAAQEKKWVETDVFVSPKTFQNEQGLWDVETIKAFLFASSSRLGLPIRPDPQKPTIATTPAVVFLSAEGNSFKACGSCQQEIDETQKRIGEMLFQRGFSAEWKFPSQGLPKEYFENPKDAFEWAQGYDFMALFWIRLTPNSSHDPSQFSGKVVFKAANRNATAEFDFVGVSALATALSRSVGLSLAQAAGYTRSKTFASASSSVDQSASGAEAGIENSEEMGSVPGVEKGIISEKLFTVSDVGSFADYDAALQLWTERLQEKFGAQARILPREFENGRTTFVFFRVPADFSVRDFLQSQPQLKGGRAPASEGITEKGPVYDFVPKNSGSKE